MPPLWFYPVFCLVFMVLVFAAWQVWRVQIRIWLIPDEEIRENAESLTRTHGISNAERIAVSLSLEAWRRSDAFEAGRWERVAQWLRRKAAQGAA